MVQYSVTCKLSPESCSNINQTERPAIKTRLFDYDTILYLFSSTLCHHRPRRRVAPHNHRLNPCLQLSIFISKQVCSFISGARITKSPQQCRAVVIVPSVCQHIRCGTDRPSVVSWKCAVSSLVSVEQQEDCSTEMIPWQRSSAGRSWFGWLSKV